MSNFGLKPLSLSSAQTLFRFLPCFTSSSRMSEAPSATKTRRFRTQNYKGNARALGKHDKECQDNYTMLQGFEWNQEGGGKLWRQTKDRAASLGAMGISGVWLPRTWPAERSQRVTELWEITVIDRIGFATAPTKASSQEGNGYDIYDLYDLVSDQDARPTFDSATDFFGVR